eukprot:CAMPEP_0202104092 /NCGR_PEP_ID=MMETSP0965-20130614/5275_1 /ASSEMBLY_ACC=CAM_ASM_000507 /TAXON_ID=4773 /ORGANISM="Schizochytrium aggregatum, Strain ATCC28209" /LENGTH=32 /DNA_ID= /DNA_START= /DNA_END= /DNA_ORIENTATION=
MGLVDKAGEGGADGARGRGHSPHPAVGDAPAS